MNDIQTQVNQCSKKYTDMYLKVAKYLDKDTVDDAEEIMDFIVSIVNEHVKTSMSEQLQVASSYGDYNKVKFLIAPGVDIHKNADIALLNAVAWNHIEITKLLLESGADVNALSAYALRFASQYGKPEIVKLLIDYGADISVKMTEAENEQNPE